MEINNEIKTLFIQNAVEIVKQAATGTLGTHTGRFVSEAIEVIYNKQVEIAQKSN